MGNCSALEAIAICPDPIDCGNESRVGKDLLASSSISILGIESCVTEVSEYWGRNEYVKGRQDPSFSCGHGWNFRY